MMLSRTDGDGHWCAACSVWVNYGQPHYCGTGAPSPFPDEAIELLKEIRDYMKDLKALKDDCLSPEENFARIFDKWVADGTLTKWSDRNKNA